MKTAVYREIAGGGTYATGHASFHQRLKAIARLSATGLCLGVLASPVAMPHGAPAETFAGADLPDGRLLDIRASATEAPIPDAQWYLLAPRGKVMEWVHPLAGSRELPDKVTRQFGAARPGDDKKECGGGHCGVDLGRRIGTVVQAVQAGEVVRVNTDPSRSGGRYVILRHEAGIESEYMHLQRVSLELKPGDRVGAGQYLGTLGKSGIYHSEPHLHFAVTRTTRSGERRYVDPEPMLQTARLMPAGYQRFLTAGR